MDVLRGYVVAAFMSLQSMYDMEDKPANVPLFSLMNDDEKRDWIHYQADLVMDIEKLKENIKLLEIDCQKLCEMKEGTAFHCALCGKHYVTEGHFRNHL